MTRTSKDRGYKIHWTKTTVDTGSNVPKTCRPAIAWLTSPDDTGGFCMPNKAGIFSTNFPIRRKSHLLFLYTFQIYRNIRTCNRINNYRNWHQSAGISHQHYCRAQG